MTVGARELDTLVVTMTLGTSLRTWDEAGILEREAAVYRALAGAIGELVLVEYVEAASSALIERFVGESGLRVRTVGGGERAAALVRETVGVGGRVVVKAHQFAGGSAAVAACRSLRRMGVGAGLVARGGYHWSWFVEREQGRAAALWAAASEEEAALLEAADYVVCTTSLMRTTVAAQHGVDASRFRIVPNYVSPSMGGGGAVSAEVLERVERGALCVGRLEPQKRVHRVIEAAAEAGVCLTIVGDGSLRSELEDQACAKGVDAVFLGRLGHDAVRALMRRCGVFVQLSDAEGHPKTVLEAMYEGAPLIVARSPGLHEPVRDGVTGVVVDDVAEAGAHLDELMRDEKRRRSLGEAARREARERYAVEAVAGLELRVYREALAAGRRRAA
jgi:glycosyltransferase involved in cell wall biosynthesis